MLASKHAYFYHYIFLYNVIFSGHNYFWPNNPYEICELVVTDDQITTKHRSLILVTTTSNSKLNISAFNRNFIKNYNCHRMSVLQVSLQSIDWSQFLDSSIRIILLLLTSLGEKKTEIALGNSSGCTGNFKMHACSY